MNDNYIISFVRTSITKVVRFNYLGFQHIRGHLIQLRQDEGYNDMWYR